MAASESQSNRSDWLPNRSSNPFPVSLSDLRQRMTERLNRGDIAVLWFDLFSTTLENDLPRISLSGCVIELITRALQVGVAEELMRALMQSYPYVLEGDKPQIRSILSDVDPVEVINLPYYISPQYSEVKSNANLSELPIRSPIVYISYSWDSEVHRDRVRELSDRLRRDGIDTRLDSYIEAPVGGWERWQQEQVSSSDFVLLVCTERYRYRFENNSEEYESGVHKDGRFMQEVLQNNPIAEKKKNTYIPVGFGPHSIYRSHVPILIGDVTYYNLNDDKGYELLFGRLTNQYPDAPAPIGPLRALPTRYQSQANTTRHFDAVAGEQSHKSSEKSLFPLQPVLFFPQAKDSVRERALILKGGGVKGLAYVGALKELEPHFSFNWFVGTSAGAIVALLLAAGYTPAELEAELSIKKFTDFKDARGLRKLTNLIHRGGLYEARTFTSWIDDLLQKKLKKNYVIELRDLPHHVTIYASQQGSDAVVFDSLDPATRKEPAAFVARCSMAIPFYFTPEKKSGLPVRDGGMRHNYPVKDFLQRNPETKFIGLYLGTQSYRSVFKASSFSDLIPIWTEAIDNEMLREYEQQTIVIDPEPISTIDFSLTNEEKSFLVSVGQIAARGFLAKNIGGANLEEIEKDRQQIEVQRRVLTAKRKKRGGVIAFSVALSLIIAPFLAYRYLWPSQRPTLSAQNNVKSMHNSAGVSTAENAIASNVHGVVLGRNGQPLSGAFVSIDQHPELHDTTDAKGNYKIEMHLPPSEFLTLHAEYDGHRSDGDDVFPGATHQISINY